MPRTTTSEDLPLARLIDFLIDRLFGPEPAR